MVIKAHIETAALASLEMREITAEKNDYTHCHFRLLILLSFSLPSSIPEAMTLKVHKPELSGASSLGFFFVSSFFFLCPLSKAHSSTFPFRDWLHHLVVNLPHQQDKILNHRGNRLWVVSSTRVFLFPGRLNWEEEIYPEGRQHHLGSQDPISQHSSLPVSWL